MSNHNQSENDLSSTISFQTSNVTVSTAAGNSTVGPVTSTEYYKIGVALSICGNIIIAVALNCQKLGHRKRNAKLEADKGSGREETANESKPLISPNSYLRYGVWWAGIVLMALGEVGNFVAYGFAPASVVAPLGSFAVIANGFVAMIMNEERLRMRDIIGTTFALVGCFFIVQFSDQNDAILSARQIVQHLGNWQFIIYVFVLVIVFSVISFVRANYTSEGHVILHLALVSIVGSFTVISAKAVSGMLTLTAAGHQQLVYPIFYIMIAVLVVTIIYQVKFLNEAMALYDIAVVVPVNFVMFTVSAIMAGALFYDEFFSQQGVTILLFFFGCALSIVGVIFITGDKPPPADPHADNADDSAAAAVAASGGLHLDMMPAFIRSLAPSLTVAGVQPHANTTQVYYYPDDGRSTRCEDKEAISKSSTDEDSAKKRKKKRLVFAVKKGEGSSGGKKKRFNYNSFIDSSSSSQSS